MQMPNKVQVRNAINAVSINTCPEKSVEELPKHMTIPDFLITKGPNLCHETLCVLVPGYVQAPFVSVPVHTP